MPGVASNLLSARWLFKNVLQQLGYADCFLAKKVIESDVRRAPSIANFKINPARNSSIFSSHAELAPDSGTLVRDRLTSSIDKLAGL